MKYFTYFLIFFLLFNMLCLSFANAQTSTDAANESRGVMPKISQAIKTFFEKVFQFIKKIIQKIIEWLKNNVWPYIKGWLSKQKSAIKQGVAEEKQELKQDFQKSLSNAWTKLVEKLKSFIN